MRTIWPWWRYSPQDETATIPSGALVRVVGDGSVSPWGHDEFTGLWTVLHGLRGGRHAAWWYELTPVPLVVETVELVGKRRLVRVVSMVMTRGACGLEGQDVVTISRDRGRSSWTFFRQHTADEAGGHYDQRITRRERAPTQARALDLAAGWLWPPWKDSTAWEDSTKPTQESPP